MLIELTMKQFLLHLHIFLIFYVLVTGGGNDPGYLPDHVSITCGSAKTYAVAGSRTWIGDADSGLAPLLQIDGSSTTSRNGDPIPYATARISRSHFSYTFHLKPGPKLIGLHFNPIPYLRGIQDLFSVEAGDFILLTQFSASAAANAFGERFVVKQFYLNVKENKKLEMVFSADKRGVKDDAYVFINGIEITSLPLHLSHFHGGGIKVVGKNYLVYIDEERALEMIYHVHMRRNYAADDSRHLQRDGRVIHHTTWSISVDLGFSYLVRLHFCDIGLKMAKIGLMNYSVSIDDTIVASTEEEFEERGYKKFPFLGYHMVIDKGSKWQGTTRDLPISVLSNSELKNEHGPLKELEIFKLSNSYNSFARPQSLVSDENAIVILAVTIVTLVVLIAHDLLKKLRTKSIQKGRKQSAAMGANLCRQFSLAEIREATNGFSHGLILGKGGFGVVYKGFINGGRQTVAIKRLKPNSWQGEHEFRTEIKMLSKLQHVNLVSLIGYCREQLELILVYEFMAGGTLFDRLFKHGKASSYHLSWKQRLKICIGASRGLDYLHSGFGVIHRDVKTSNILLNENLRAKISDFGLAKLDSTSDRYQGYGSTVKGTLGYLDPNYTSTRKLTQKSDTYAFGVVLLEVLCRRLAMDTRVVEEGKRSLATWAQEMMHKGKINQIIDPSLRQEISFNSLDIFMEIVKGCLHKDPNNRPTMAQVVQKLESALSQQEDAESTIPRRVKADHPWKLLYSDLKAATDNFSRANVIAEGVSNTIIYKGKLSNGLEVSIKRFKSSQEKTSFTLEFNFLWKLFHPNLARLVGICENGKEFFFVYEQTPNRSLYDQLHGNSSKALNSWKLRITILLGVARGIDYLHNGTDRSIVHRHVNSSNIWLDADWAAKVSFYGLSSIDVGNEFHPWVVPGNDAIWFVDPESFLNHVVSKKHDVYSLGIVLLEVLTGNRAVFMFESDGGAVGNAMKAIREDKIGSVLDPRAGPCMTRETRALKFVADMAVRCVSLNGKNRPDVRDVVSVLERALALLNEK